MICFDANILIEIILERANVQACRDYIAAAKEDLGITMLSLDLVMYYAERHKLSLAPIEEFLRLFIWLPLTDSDAEWAFAHYQGDDFEDALQLGCAVREGSSRFVTLDHGLAKKYAAVLPVDLLA